MLKLVNWLLVVLHWGSLLLMLVLVEQTAQSLENAWGVGRFRGSGTGGADILVGGRRGSTGSSLAEVIVVGLSGVDCAQVLQSQWLFLLHLLEESGSKSLEWAWGVSSGGGAGCTVVHI